MKSILILSTALCGVAFGAMAQEVNVVSWGGAYEVSQVEAYNKPFTAETGITVNMIAADNPATPLRAQVEAGNVTGDVFDVEVSDAIRLCDEGALVEIDPADLPSAPDGTAAADDFVPGALQVARSPTSSGARSFRSTRPSSRERPPARRPISSTPRPSRASAACPRTPSAPCIWR